MNTLAIEVTLNRDRTRRREWYLDFLLTVDGQELHDPENHWIDPVDLAMSAGVSGELFIFTCSCGEPSCVGIDEGILVSHTPDQVVWLVRDPLAWPIEEELPEWVHDEELRFDRRDYVETVRAALRQAKEYARNWPPRRGRLWVGPDLAIEELLVLEIPNVFGAGLAQDHEVLQ